MLERERPQRDEAETASTDATVPQKGKSAMHKREDRIIYQLAASEVPMTAQQIAKHLGVSSRTVKTAMKEVRETLIKEGASLIAKRNEGYSIRVDDQNRFLAFLQQLNGDSSLLSSPTADYMSSFLYIARKLISSSKYVKIDDVAEEMFTSRSALREPIRATMDFLSSYDLIAESTPGLGIRAYGLEHHARLAMTELYVDHYGKLPDRYSDTDGIKLIGRDEAERRSIKHSALGVLASSGIRISDPYARRLALYLVIARNRYEAGYRVILPNTWLSEINQYREFGVAQSIFAALSKQYAGFEMPMQEIAFVAIWLLCNRDMGGVTATAGDFPTLFDTAAEYAATLMECIRAEYHICLDRFEWFAGELQSVLIPMIAKVHFGLGGAKTIDALYTRQIGESPVALELARTMMGVLEKGLGYHVLEEAHIRRLASLIYKVLMSTSYETKKLRLLIVNSNGLNSGINMKHTLVRYFGLLIESCTCCEYYETREQPSESYDALIQNTVPPAEQLCDLNLPLGTMHTIPQEGELIRIHNTVLLQAYQYRQFLPDPSIIHVYQDFDYVSKEQFLQLISYKHCNVGENQKQFEGILLDHDRIATYQNDGRMVILFGKTALVENESIEVYFLKFPGDWEGNEIRHILYLCTDWKDELVYAKALDDCLCQLAHKPELFQLFIEDKATAFEKLLGQSLKL